MSQSPVLKTRQMQIGGMDCTSCKMKIEGKLERLKGVNEASVTVDTGRLVVSYDPVQVNEETIAEQIQVLGYTIDTANPTVKKAHDHSGHDHSGHDHADEGHNHNYDSGDFDFKTQLFPVLFSVVLLVIATLWEKPLHDTPYHIA